MLEVRQARADSLKKKADLRKIGSTDERSFKRINSFASNTTSFLAMKMHEEESKMQTLSLLKKNSQFSQRIRGFKEQILKWVTELCKEESRRDFDNMAKLISDYEKLEHEGVIGWALGRIHAYFPTIDQAEKKLNGVIEAVQYKNKRFQ